VNVATRRVSYPIEPMDLANMRENGVRSLDVQCHQCLHSGSGWLGRPSPWGTFAFYTLQLSRRSCTWANCRSGNLFQVRRQGV